MIVRKISYGLLIFSVLLIVACSAPKPMYSWTQDSENAPAVVIFSNESEKADSFVWEFGDGTTSYEDSPSHRYILSGRYTVTLKGIKEGKEKSIKKDIIIGPPTVCLVEMVTDSGTMMIQLSDETPGHRDNFIKLAEEGYYDGLLFHRVIKGFMIQGGDPQSKDAAKNASLGIGGPGYTVPAEFVDSLLHFKGAIAAARKGDAVNPDRSSSGSQFYIVQGQKLTETQLDQIEGRIGKIYSPDQRNKYIEEGGTPFLDTQYTVFGYVVDGMEVIDKIATTKTSRNDRPLDDIRILKINVIK